MKLAIAAVVSALISAGGACAQAQGSTSEAPPPSTGNLATTASVMRASQDRIVLPEDVTPSAYDISIRPDPRALSYTGSVTIDLVVHRAVREIELNSADIGFDRVRLSGHVETPTVSLDPVQQTARFGFATPIAPGRYTLSIDYHGRIYQQASGLFALDYDTPKGKERALFTQFENSDARRFVPCWDEPGRKATFDLTVIVPADEMAISNMPIASSAQMAGGLRRVRFTQTPKMSSYLLFFGLGDFQRVSRKVDGVDVGVVVKRGDLAQADFALDAAAQILPYYDSYFGTKFPLPKLDLIGGPGSSQFFGAMENWGAIFYFERDLLIDPRIATESDRQNVYIVVAHEMAHQWFGDLVTMQWWDDLWLNEGFASWMENKVTDHFHPEWKVWLQQLNAKQGAMQVDAKAGTHPIITPIKDVLQASGAFDDITYNKGASVIRMLEAYTGEDAWRDGVRRYIAAHAYGNAVTDDLWREIDTVSPRKITGIAHDFTLQAGVPMIEVRQGGCYGDRVSGQVGLTQGRFGLDEADKAPRTWSVPVIVKGSVEGAQTLLVSRADEQTVKTNCPSIVDAGQTGYFRTLYDGKAFAAALAKYAALSPDDQLGLLNDVGAEASAGYAPMAEFLDLSTHLPTDTNPVVGEALADDLARLDTLYDGLPGQTRLRSYIRTLFDPVLGRLTWDARPGDPTNTESERTTVLSLLGRIGDPAVVREANFRFAALRNGGKLDPSVREAVLSVVSRNADAATWEQIHALARSASSDLEKREYYELLGRAQDETLARQALDLALSGEPAPTTAPGIISGVSGRHPGLALAFVDAHWDKVSPLLDSSARDSYAPRLASRAADLSVADALNRFADARIPATARGDVTKAVAQIRYSAQVRSERLPEVDRWLATHGS